MAGSDYRAVMRVIADGLPESLQTSLEAVKTVRIDETWGTDVEFKGWILRTPVPSHELFQGLELVKRALMPASSMEISGLLSELRAQCRTRSESTSDIVFQIEVYVRKLQNWPADVVRGVLLTWPDEHDFWPSWRELKLVLEYQTERRRGLAEALQRAIDEVLVPGQH